jgi:BlaI family transcriptional regulator, penicillinase repressor
MPLGFSDRELDILTVLWDLGEGSVAEVRERLAADLAYNTVLTVLRILERKGHVAHRRRSSSRATGRAHIYFPKVSRDRAGRSMLRRLLETVFRHSPGLLVTELVAERKLSKEDLAQIEAALRQRS